MPTHTRVLAYGGAAALVVVGALCAVLIEGTPGGALAIGLITLGLGGAVLLVFYEVGLSEDRALAREERRRKQPPRPAARRPTRRFPRRPA
jgi:hypothetical protein